MPLANDKPLSEHQKPLNWNLQQPVARLPNPHLFCNMAHFQLISKAKTRSAPAGEQPLPLHAKVTVRTKCAQTMFLAEK